MNYILYNPISGHGKSEEIARSIEEKNKGGAECVDMTKIEAYADFFSGVAADDVITICGGDGTLNRFINDTKDVEIKNRIFYFPAGTGNDFWIDITDGTPTEPVEITKYLKNLPTVTVNGKDYKFINGVGYGIDGYCCEVGDEVRKKGKVANYTAIAIKGLLFKFKPRNATIIIDGVEKEYKKVWIAPAMFGGHYGGGMLPTPGQSRDNEPKKLSICIFHGSGKIKTLMIFPKIFKGEHVKSEKHVKVVSGSEITVKYDRPTALQIDGETILGVTEYTARI